MLRFAYKIHTNMEKIGVLSTEALVRHCYVVLRSYSNPQQQPHLNHIRKYLCLNLNVIPSLKLCILYTTQ
jgi:hypothetical protein